MAEEPTSATELSGSSELAAAEGGEGSGEREDAHSGDHGAMQHDEKY